MNKERTIDEIIKDVVIERLLHYRGSMLAASKSLGLSKSSLYRYCKKWGVSPRGSRAQ